VTDAELREFGDPGVGDDPADADPAPFPTERGSEVALREP
jgi:hypothetical protein